MIVGCCILDGWFLSVTYKAKLITWCMDKNIALYSYISCDDIVVYYLILATCIEYASSLVSKSFLVCMTKQE